MISKELIKETALISAIIILFCPMAGAICNYVLTSVIRLLLSVIDRRGLAYVFFMNRITFIGVIHHELSHALLAFFTGAKIKKISLYKMENGHLGSVSYVPRGLFIMRSIQMSLASAAPVFMGAITELLLINYLRGNSVSTFVMVILSYVLISIAVHMDMSTEDIVVYLKGAPCCYALFFVAILIVRSGLLAG